MKTSQILLLIGTVIAGWFVWKKYGGSSAIHPALPTSNSGSATQPLLSAGTQDISQANALINQTGSILSGTGQLVGSLKSWFGSGTPAQTPTPATPTPANLGYDPNNLPAYDPSQGGSFDFSSDTTPTDTSLFDPTFTQDFSVA